MSDYVPIARPFLDDSELENIKLVLESGWLTQGSWVSRVEKRIAEMHEMKFGLATTSCTTALHLALLSQGVGPGDEVIVPAFTWVSTANAVLYCGAKPVFVDIDPDTFNIDLNLINFAVSEKTKAIVPVHLFGLSVDIFSLKNLVPKHIAVVEDAACGVGGSYFGVPIGTLGDATCLSFHPRKSITCGEGGMVLTNDPETNLLVECMRNHGASISEESRHQGLKPFELPEFEKLGFNYRMTDLQAAVLLAQVEKFEKIKEYREILAQNYDYALSDITELSLPYRHSIEDHAWQSYVITVPMEKRDQILNELHLRGYGARPGTHSVPHLGYFQRNYGYSKSNYPKSLNAQNSTIALPLHNGVNTNDVMQISEVIKSSI